MAALGYTVGCFNNKPGSERWNRILFISAVPFSLKKTGRSNLNLNLIQKYLFELFESNLSSAVDINNQGLDMQPLRKKV